MTTYDAWIESEPPEDKDALIDSLEREVEWLRGLIHDIEFASGSPGRRICHWCFVDCGASSGHRADCEAFTLDGKVRSKFL